MPPSFALYGCRHLLSWVLKFEKVPILQSKDVRRSQ